MGDRSDLLVGGLVVALIVYRQLRPRPVHEERPYLVIAILGVVGLAEAIDFTRGHAMPAIAWALLMASLVNALVFGALRGATVRVWRAGGVLTRQGSPVTLALWGIGLALHLVIDHRIGHGAAAGLGSAALLLYLAITLAAQRVVTLERAQRVEQPLLHPR